MLNIINPSLSENCRIICVSDIHTHWKELHQLLEQCNYQKGQDHLFILGDILERGRNNTGTLQYVMELCKNERVHLICGNNDTYVTGLALRYDDEKFMERFPQKPESCFAEMAKAIGITDFTENTAEKRRLVYEHFKEEIEFIHSLPDAIETEDFIFVHAGILDKPDWKDCEKYDVMLIPRFADKAHHSPKTVICGHFPTYAIGRNNNCLPIFDFEKRIIDIDGGAGVKPAAQLNALIINKHGNDYTYHTEFLPLGENHTVCEDHEGSGEWSFSDYEMHSFEQLDKPAPEGMGMYRNLSTGAEGAAPYCMSGIRDGTLHVWGNLNSFPAVHKGEPIWTFAEYGEYFWCITASGDVGNVRKNLIS